jgi:hypothetical protein
MTYRDELQAARMRRDALARELHQVRSRMDELHDLAQTADALERELAQCSRDLDQARAKVELPLLAQVQVASPCKVRWDDMRGDERVRFCGRCEKNVYDLSSVNALQAESLLREHGESMCVRFFRRSDGTILTSDCQVRRRKRFWRRAATTAVASSLAAAGIAMSSMSGMFVHGEMARRPPPEIRIEKVQALGERLEDVQLRLSQATTAAEMQAIGSELESLRAEIIGLQSR